MGPVGRQLFNYIGPPVLNNYLCKQFKLEINSLSIKHKDIRTKEICIFSDLMGLL